MNFDVRLNRVRRPSFTHSPDQNEAVDVPTQSEEKLHERSVDAETVGVSSVRDLEICGEPTRHADELIAVVSHEHIVLPAAVAPSRLAHARRLGAPR